MHDTIPRPGPATADPLARRLGELRAQWPALETAMVDEVVRAVLSTLSGDLTVKETSLLTEVEELGKSIASAKAEIAALRVDEITDAHIPFATDELDAIVAHTASATHAILESCETLDAVANEVAGTEAEKKLQDATTRIYEACSFQDITGQRKSIEAKIDQIVDTFGARGGEGKAPPVAVVASEADLLNGPQLPAHAMDQSDIDKLLASFD